MENIIMADMQSILDFASEEMIESLSKDDDYAIRVQVAAHPRTNVDILRQLACDHKQGVKLALMRNPNSPSDLIDNIVRCDNTNNILNAAFQASTNPNISDDTLKFIILNRKYPLNAMAMTVLCQRRKLELFK